MVSRKKISRIGEILVARNVVDEETLNDALKVGKETGKRIGRVLIDMGLIDEATVSSALAEQFNIPFVNLQKTVIDPQTLKLIPEDRVREHKLLPLSVSDDILQLAVADPLDVIAFDEVKRLTGLNIQISVATPSDIDIAIEQHYGKASGVTELASTVDVTNVELTGDEADAPERLERVAEDVSIVQLINSIILRAVEERASDIHLEPDVDALRVRMRIDGVLHEMTLLEQKLHPAVISRVKILGDLNIAEKRLPQDGRFFMVIGEKEVDVRISLMPTIYGEKAVLRILDKSSMVFDLDLLSPFPESLSLLKSMIKKPHGILLLTGPTGSGKTTTAYTLINMLNSIEKNIVTVEDPVEYQMKIVNQIQINPKVGIMFATALRHILRQDPDIIMVGEIRDKDTAEVAIRAALTGHLVISTIHTNDAVSTVGRLLDMGIEPFLVSSSLIGTVGQRLLRLLCTDCKKSYTPERAVVEELGIELKANEPIPTFYKGEGCPSCRGRGFKGRFGLFEIFVLDDHLRSLISQRKDTMTISKAARERGFITLRDQGIKAVLEGYTTVEEILIGTQG